MLGLMAYLTPLHCEGELLARETGQSTDFGAGLCSLFHWAAVALGIDPKEVHRPLAHLVRAPNEALPAHLDPDRRGRIPNYYVRSLLASAGQTRGSQLIVRSTQLGGKIVEIPTDLLTTKEALIVSFDPSAQLHFVNVVLERSCSARDEGRSCLPAGVCKKGGGAMALMPRCYAARTGLVRLLGRLPVGMGALSDTAALGDRGTSVLERSCSARDEG